MYVRCVAVYLDDVVHREEYNVIYLQVLLFTLMTQYACDLSSSPSGGAMETIKISYLKYNIFLEEKAQIKAVFYIQYDSLII